MIRVITSRLRRDWTALSQLTQHRACHVRTAAGGPLPRLAGNDLARKMADYIVPLAESHALKLPPMTVCPQHALYQLRFNSDQARARSPRWISLLTFWSGATDRRPSSIVAKNKADEKSRTKSNHPYPIRTSCRVLRLYSLIA